MINISHLEVQILVAACLRFAMVRIPDNGPGWKSGRRSTIPQKHFMMMIIIIKVYLASILGQKGVVPLKGLATLSVTEFMKIFLQIS